MRLLPSAGEGEEDGKEDQRPRRPMNAVGLVTAEKVKNRAANAARTAFEAWQVCHREGPSGSEWPGCSSRVQDLLFMDTKHDMILQLGMQCPCSQDIFCIVWCA